MSSFLTGFGTGLFATAAKNIGERKDEAREYLKENLALARKNASLRSSDNMQNINNWVGSARKLEGLGVPKELVLAISNQNPDDLAVAYDQIADMQSRGVETSPEVIRGMFKVHGEVNPNESYSEFFGRMAGPVSQAYNENPKAFKNDPEGSIWATMMGHNAMERADAKLGNTMINGRPATDWIADSNMPNYPYGNAGVDVDYNAMGDAVRAAKPSSSSQPPDALEISRLRDDWADMVQGYVEDTPLGESGDVKEAAKQRAGEAYANIAKSSPENLGMVMAMGPDIVKYITPFLDDSQTGPVEELMPPDPIVEETINPDLTQENIESAQNPTTDVTLLPDNEDEFIKDYLLVRNDGGTSVWVNIVTGERVVLNNSELESKYDQPSNADAGGQQVPAEPNTSTSRSDRSY